MARQNVRDVRTRATTPLATATAPNTVTFEGAPAYTMDTLTELFTLATTHLAEGTFYETADGREQRYTGLIQTVAQQNPLWLADMLPWLRNGANLRAASLAGAIEFGRALDAIPCASDRNATHGGPARYVTADGKFLCQHHVAGKFTLLRPRSTLDEVLRRADEPGEALAYWTSRYGRKLPMWLKRGVGDAIGRLWTENAAMKWDSPARAWRMGDVLELCHPGDSNAGKSPVRPFQQHLFPWLLAERHGRADAKTPDPVTLPRLAARASLMAIPVAQRRAVLKDPHRLEDAGMTWESLAGWLQGPMDAEAWEAIAPTMGYMALLRNLRNFDEAGMSEPAAAKIAARLINPVEVERSRQLPFRFLSAYLNAPGDRWRHPLGIALTHSVRNVPVLPGRTLYLIDVSGSMSAVLSSKSTVERWKVAALFACVAAERNGIGNSTIVPYATRSTSFNPNPGASVLRNVERFGDLFRANYDAGERQIGHGTNTAAAMGNHYAGHDRVIVFTDAQSHDGDPGTRMPANRPMYTFQLAGYGRASTAVTPNRHLVSGLDDSAFAMIERVERQHDAGWPWEVARHTADV